MSGGGYQAAYGDIKSLQSSWSGEEGKISSMASRLQSMLSELSSAAHEAISREQQKASQAAQTAKAAGSDARTQQAAAQAQQAAESRIQEIQTQLKAATSDVDSALSAVKTLSTRLSEDADKLHQTASTYQLAELAAHDHITSLGQLASYHGADAGKIQSALKGESSNEQAQLGGDAINIAYPGGSSAGLAGAGTGGSSGGSYGGSGGGSGYGGSGGGGGQGGGASGGGGYSGGGGGGGYSGGGAGTPVAPDVAASSAQVNDWVNQAIKILEKNGVPASKIDPNAIKLIIMHESGGNPNAINLTDSNAQAGHPSQGLMQCIPSTFQAYTLPGHNNIVNPVDNIIAGTRYALSRYGSLDNVPGVVAVEQGGSYVGY